MIPSLTDRMKHPVNYTNRQKIVVPTKMKRKQPVNPPTPLLLALRHFRSQLFKFWQRKDIDFEEMNRAISYEDFEIKWLEIAIFYRTKRLQPLLKRYLYNINESRYKVIYLYILSEEKTQIITLHQLPKQVLEFILTFLKPL